MSCFLLVKANPFATYRESYTTRAANDAINSGPGQSKNMAWVSDKVISFADEH